MLFLFFFWGGLPKEVDTNIIMTLLSGGHVHARGSILKPVGPHSHLAAPGVCTTMDASLPAAKIQENSNY